MSTLGRSYGVQIRVLANIAYILGTRCYSVRIYSRQRLMYAGRDLIHAGALTTQRGSKGKPHCEPPGSYGCNQHLRDGLFFYLG
ncbi:hypothetical protein V2G26_006234 [Clonostachys chloroleuca]